MRTMMVVAVVMFLGACGYEEADDVASQASAIEEATAEEPTPEEDLRPLALHLRCVSNCSTNWRANLDSCDTNYGPREGESHWQDGNAWDRCRREASERWERCNTGCDTLLGGL